MKKIILLSIFLLTELLFGQASTYYIVMRNIRGDVQTGLDVELRIGGVLIYQLTESTTYPGEYSADSVATGVYQVYVGGILRYHDILHTGYDSFNVLVSGEAIWTLDVGQTQVILVDSTNEVGIGTSNPFGKLHIQVNDVSTALVVYNNSGVATEEPIIRLGHIDPTPTDGEEVGTIQFAANGDPSLTIKSFAAIQATAEDVTDGSIDGAMTFYVTDANGFSDPFLYMSATNGIEMNTQQAEFVIYSDTLRVSSATALMPAIIAENTNTTNSTGGEFRVYHNDSNPAATGLTGSYTFHGNNSTPADVSYTAFIGQTETVTAGSEDGMLTLYGLVNGAAVAYWDISDANDFRFDPAAAGINVRLPYGSNPTVSLAGAISIDNEAGVESGIRFYADSEKFISAVYAKSFIILSPTATNDPPIWKVPYAITIRTINILVEGGTNVVGGLDEADGNGGSSSAIDSDITGSAGTNAADDGSLSNPTLDSGDYLRWHTTSVSGSIISVTVSFTFTIDPIN